VAPDVTVASVLSLQTLTWPHLPLNINVNSIPMTMILAGFLACAGKIHYANKFFPNFFGILLRENLSGCHIGLW